MRRSDSADPIYDEYGNEVRGEVRTETLCEIQQQKRGEEEDALGIGDFVLFLLPDTPLDTNDVVIVGGKMYEVMGPPWYARNPRTGVSSHVEVSLRRTGDD